MITRRKLFGGMVAALAGILTPVVAGSKKEPHVIRAGDPGSDAVEVFDRKTGERQPLVQAVCIEEGWIEQMRVYEGSIVMKSTSDWTPVIDRHYGSWGLRPANPPLTVYYGATTVDAAAGKEYLPPLRNIQWTKEDLEITRAQQHPRVCYMRL